MKTRNIHQINGTSHSEKVVVLMMLLLKKMKSQKRKNQRLMINLKRNQRKEKDLIPTRN